MNYHYGDFGRRNEVPRPWRDSIQDRAQYAPYHFHRELMPAGFRNTSTLDHQPDQIRLKKSLNDRNINVFIENSDENQVNVIEGRGQTTIVINHSNQETERFTERNTPNQCIKSKYIHTSESTRTLFANNVNSSEEAGFDVIPTFENLQSSYPFERYPSYSEDNRLEKLRDPSDYAKSYYVFQKHLKCFPNEVNNDHALHNPDDIFHANQKSDLIVSEIKSTDFSKSKIKDKKPDGELTGKFTYFSYVVDHSYIDFSRIDDKDVTEESDIVGETLESIIFGIPKKKKLGDFGLCTSKTRNIKSFPRVLMQILDDNQDPRIISWLPHGRSFIVLDQRLFMDQVLPKYSASIQFKTFQRKLNLWGFKRITGKVDNGSYYHQCFLKGKSNLVRKMTLKKKKNGYRPCPDPDGEPDFYALDLLRPLHQKEQPEKKEKGKLRCPT